MCTESSLQLPICSFSTALAHSPLFHVLVVPSKFWLYIPARPRCAFTAVRRAPGGGQRCSSLHHGKITHPGGRLVARMRPGLVRASIPWPERSSELGSVDGWNTRSPHQTPAHRRPPWGPHQQDCCKARGMPCTWTRHGILYSSFFWTTSRTLAFWSSSRGASTSSICSSANS